MCASTTTSPYSSRIFCVIPSIHFNAMHYYSFEKDLVYVPTGVCHLLDVFLLDETKVIFVGGHVAGVVARVTRIGLFG